MTAEAAHHRTAPSIVSPMTDLATDRIFDPGFVVDGAPAGLVGVVEQGGRGITGTAAAPATSGDENQQQYPGSLADRSHDVPFPGTGASHGRAGKSWRI